MVKEWIERIYLGRFFSTIKNPVSLL